MADKQRRKEIKSIEWEQKKSEICRKEAVGPGGGSFGPRFKGKDVVKMWKGGNKCINVETNKNGRQCFKKDFFFSTNEKIK